MTNEYRRARARIKAVIIAIAFQRHDEGIIRIEVVAGVWMLALSVPSPLSAATPVLSA